MRDPDIRAALVKRLRRYHPDPTDTRIWPEMSVGLGASRIDVAMVNGEITGHEIKSERDNLDRLPSQVIHYGRCLDRAVIVVSANRADAVASHVPAWWGITVAAPGRGDSVTLNAVRRSLPNPEIEPFYVAQLLWRDEAYEVLERHGLHDNLKKATRWELWDKLAGELDLRDLRLEVRNALKARLVA